MVSYSNAERNSLHNKQGREKYPKEKGEGNEAAAQTNREERCRATTGNSSHANWPDLSSNKRW